MANKNYFAHGGSELVIGGKLRFLPGAVIEGAEDLCECVTDLDLELEYEPPVIEDSTATTVAALRENHNALLAALRKAGILASEENETAAVGDEVLLEAPNDPDSR